ncbi:hypothetical protein QT994_26220, partial [Microcoleus sp. S13_B4]
MHTLTEDEFHLEAEPFLRKVFVHDNPFKEPFSSQVISCYAAKPDKIALPLFLIFRSHLIT